MAQGESTPPGRRGAGPMTPPTVAVPGGGLTAPTAREQWSIPGYEVEKVIGRGGFAVVLAARRAADRAPVAIKVARADPTARAQLAREAQALGAVGPPAAPVLLEEGALPDGTPFLALERIALPTLKERLASAGGKLTPAEAGPRALAVLDALGAVHAAGWAHCDLAPANVFAGADVSAARLFDFGLAERLDEEAPPPAPGLSFAGTPEYMAPEQCEGRARPDARSDVYAFGALLHHLLLGRPPFTGSPAEVQQAHLNLRPRRPSELGLVSPAVEQVLLRCLAKDPAARYPDAFLLRAALAAALARDAVAGPPPTEPARAEEAAAWTQEKRPVAVLFLDSGADALEIQAAAVQSGGHLAHAGTGRFAVVFDAGAGENPARLALDGAFRLHGRGLAPRMRVDLATVTVQRREGGPPLYLSPALSRPDRYPARDDPEGPLATAAAVEILAEVPFAPVPEREGLFRALPESRPDDPTVIRQRAAPLVGRGPEVESLLALARHAFAGSSPTVAEVVAEAGLGKSHLAAEVGQALRRLEPAPEVLELKAREPSAGEEGGTLRALLRWALDLPAASAPDDRGRSLLSAGFPPEMGPDLWAAAALALGWIGPEAPELRAALAAPGALRALSVRAAGEALRRRALRRPLCVLLDDAHLADGLALDALEYAALAEGGAPILVLALARPAFRDARPAFGERAARFGSLPLAPLPAGAAADLCRLLLLPAENVPERAVERLVARSQAVPMLLVELVRGLKREGLVRRREEGAWYLATDELERVPDLPLLDWLAERELSALPEDLAAHARLAALLGDEFTLPEVSGVLAQLEKAGLATPFPHDAQAGTRRLLGAGLLVTHRGDRIGFRSGLLREAVARSLAPPQAVAIHQAAFRYYRGAFALPEALRQPRLARHAEACGEEAEAAAIHLGLAEGQRARQSYLEAEIHYSRALRLLPPAQARSRLLALRGRGLMRYRIGRYQDSIADLSAARDLAAELSDAGAQVECLLDEATALDWMNDYSGSMERVEAARLLCGPDPSPLTRGRLRLAEGRGLFRAGRWPEASAALEDAALRGKALGDQGYETLVIALLLLAVVLPNLSRIDEAEAVVAQGLELCQQRGDQLHLGGFLNNRRNLWVARRDLMHALEDVQRFMRTGRELGMVSIEYFGEYNLGELHYQAGQFEAALPHVARAVEIERRHPEVSPGPVGLLLAARVAAARGDAGEARDRLAEVDEALRRAREEGRPGGELSPSQEVLRAMVDLASRPASPSPDDAWQALLARSRQVSVEQEPIELQLLRGLSAIRAGRREAGERALRAALRLAASLPNVMEPWVRRELGRLREPG
ncbi:MAG TPA: protein kinase [Anaeromyxobacteraceae bacterium]|nr:protein kinase [Anaeromyxobacteraceae bacterium]